MSPRTARRAKAAVVALLASLAATSRTAAQNAELVKDITPPAPVATAGDLEATGFLTAGNKLFFVAGNDVWVTDGTAAGTELLGDGCGGACESPQLLASAEGLAFWVATADAPRLIRSDGTRAGTYPLPGPTGDLSPETGSSEILGPSFAVLGDTLYLAGCQSTQPFGCNGEEAELWRSDGTAAGTRRVLADDTRDRIDELTVWNGGLYYLSLQNGTHSLWTSDGTAAGTRKVADLGDGARRLTALADRLVFIAALASDGGDELWASDGTATGTGPITDFAAPAPFDLLPGDSAPALRALGGRAYFLADDIVHGAEIWTSDGTAAGTRRVTEFGFHAPFASGELRAGLLGTRLVFVATDGLSPQKLWTTDGTPESTAAISNALPASGTDLVPLGPRLVFVNGGSGSEIWSTDGTAAGTKQLADICPGACGGAVSAPRLLAGGAVFVGIDGAGKSDLWTTDGTVAGTRRLTHLGTVDAETPLASFGGRLFFDAVGTRGRALFESDASPSGARLVAESWDDPGTILAAPAEIGGRLIFTTCNFQASWSAWSSDGTAAGTLPFASGSDGFCPSILSLGTAGGHLFFSASDGLWATDGTAAGTVSLPFDIFSFLGGIVTPFGNRLFYGLSGFPSAPPAIWASDGTLAGTRKAFDLPSGLARFGHVGTGANKLFFDGTSADGQTGAIWATDGTAAGLVKIADLKVDTPLYRAVGSRVFFFHVDPITAREEVWVTDGTPAGTFRAATLPFGNGDVQAVDATAYGGALLFFVDDYDSAALWRSDGTAAGTVELHEFVTDVSGDGAPSFTVAGGLLYFTADDGDHGVELWQSDGTAAGTVLTRDVLPGPASSQPSQLTAFGGRLYFTAADGVHGTELWQSDGTAAGTHLTQDVAPGLPGSNPDQLTVAGDHLFFTADDGLHGRELWALPRPGSTAGCEPSPAHLCLQGGRFRVEADWRDFQGNTGTGTAVSLTPDTGYFWFFNPANVEVVTKVLDGRGVNQAFWVFYGALSSVEYELTVTDTETGLTRRYENPAGELASVGDTHGFGPLGAFERDTTSDTEPPHAARSLTLVAARTDPRAATGSCAAGPGRLCLSGGRFAVTADWKDFQGHAGDGTAVPLTGDTGYFWFFDPANVEVVAKVIDGRPVNDKFWLFYGALSSVEYTLTVTDAQTGTVKMYKNASGNLASVADTGAF